jgi:hypothetical protein
MTTRMRGRLEREEAWRTRLIQSADEMNVTLVTALGTLGNLLPAASIGDVPLRGSDGSTFTPEARAKIESVDEVLNQAQVQLARLELLFSTESNVYTHGYDATRQLGRAYSLLKGRSRAQRLIQAVLAERERPGAGSELLSDASAIADMQTLVARGSLPDGFDPSDDMSVASWAREWHHAAGEAAHWYMQAAHAYIEQYKLD